MTKAMLQQRLDYFKMVHGVTRRLIEQCPADKIDFRPVPDVRSFAETVEHMYGFFDAAMKIVKSGNFQEDTKGHIKSQADLLAFVDQMWQSAMQNWDGVTDGDLSRVVESYGTSFPAWQFLVFAFDEHWHHRGALTVYLRLLGVTPLMIYDY